MFRISIHAPSWERQIKNQNIFYIGTFQSTLPYGSDLSNFVSYRDLSDFNPRSLAGATYEAPACPFDTDISIHAPSRERLCQSFFIVGFSYFNPRSLTGATKAHAYLLLQGYNFNPRSLAGATNADGGAGGKFNDFNPRSLAGAT